MDNLIDKAEFPEMLASMVHDMKNSLGMILSTLEETIAACEPENCRSAKGLSHMQYETKRLNNNLVQLLSLYKMNHARFSLNISGISVSEFLHDTVLQSGPMLKYKGVAVEIDCTEDLLWFFDNVLVAGVINNVLNNAYRYAKDRLRISAGEDSGYLVISIEDNGEGYPEAMTDLSCCRPGSTNFSTGSTGLGIYFASLTASLHKNRGRQGYVRIINSSSLGGGCFSIYLP